MEQAILWLLSAGALLGGLDLLFGNRFHLGEHFKEGFALLGPTALSMVGILCFAPLLSRALEETAAPLFRLIGLDPALLGGVLAIDMGGYQTAHSLAQRPAMGEYAGILVASTLGCTVTFTIPMGTGMIPKESLNDFFRGVLIGLVLLPFALLLGGAVCGLPVLYLFVQSLPVFLLALLIGAGLRLFPRQTLRFFSGFAALLRWLSILGLTLGAAQYICGKTLLPGLAPAEDAMKIVAGIGLFMAGSLPAAELLRRALARPLRKLGHTLGLRDDSLTTLLVGFVSVTPALAMFKKMDARGRTVTAAFLVCAASTLASHLGFTLSVAPEMMLPLLLTKSAGGVLGAAAALALTRKGAA